jgi:hypothetical protein
MSAPATVINSGRARRAWLRQREPLMHGARGAEISTGAIANILQRNSISCSADGLFQHGRRTFGLRILNDEGLGCRAHSPNIAKRKTISAIIAALLLMIDL